MRFNLNPTHGTPSLRPGTTFRAYVNRDEATRFLNLFYMAREKDQTHACEHGHFDCSNVPGGPCFDEVLANFPNLDD